jgi:trigger factor
MKDRWFRRQVLDEGAYGRSLKVSELSNALIGTRAVGAQTGAKMKFSKLLMAVLAAGVVLVGCKAKTETLADMDVSKYVTLGNYHDLTVTLAPAAVSDEELDTAVDSFFQSYVTEDMWVTDRPVKDGDVLNIDFVGKKDGVAFEGGTAESYKLIIGSKSFIDGFEDGLIGAMPGTPVDLNLTFPENYHSPDLAGQAVVFTVTVNYIVPDISDAAVAAMGSEEFSTIEELRAYAYDILLENAKSTYDINLEAAVLDAFTATCTFEELPEKMREQYTSNITANLTTMAESYQMDVDTFAV